KFGDYHGVFYGDRKAATDQQNQGTAGIGLGILSNFNASVPLMTAAESYFLQSEAALRGWTSGDDLALLKSGVRASFNYLYSRGDKADGEAAADVYISMHVTDVSLKAIILQKWVALNGNNMFEAWTEYRRTGIPGLDVLPLSKFAGLARHIPTKLMYPTSEQTTNQENYKAAIATGNDPQSSKVFWMK
ncbi:MAG: SusD/RagB family nutrient-binding outer membrane lipoprotein, partial [Ginsengibacter sp.]